MSINFELLKPSASMEVTRIAGELKKQGRKIYPLSAGDTHFPPPQSIINRLNHLPAAYSHYTNAEGIDELRTQIAYAYEGYAAADVILVPGLKQGFYYALVALQQKTLCVIEPAWLGYDATAVLANYNTVSINTYEYDWINKLQSTAFDVIIICSPNNPDGHVLTNDTVDAIITASAKNQAWIITDFIYDKYIYKCDIESHKNFFSYPRLIIGNGYSKSHAVTGFRAGYLLCKDANVIERIITMQQNLATCVPAISQYALLGAADANEEISQNSAYYHSNKEVILEIFPEWKAFEPQGGFYFFIDLSIYGIQDGKTFCENLLSQTGVALVAGAAYGNGFDSYARLSFSIDKDVLKEGLLAMKNYLNENN
jgi:aspartate/methionine/tyrosine aminotransferase